MHNLTHEVIIIVQYSYQ